MNNSGRIEFANTLRGFAALSVLISHYFGIFWIAREAVSSLTNSPALSNITHTTPHYISILHSVSQFSWGAYGVALFFLISGFVIPFSLKKLSYKEFFFNRFFRIMPVYIIGFTITLIAIFLCGIYFKRQFPYHLNEIIIHYLPGVHDILRTKNIDGIIWTLEIEVKFYVLCILGIKLFKRDSWKVFLIPLFLGISALFLNPIVLALSNNNNMLFKLSSNYVFASPYLIFMFIGVAFNYFFRNIIKSETMLFLLPILFILFALVTRESIYKDTFYLTWTYAFALITFAIAFAKQNLFKKNKIFSFFANISYPLYVVHGVAGYALLRILIDAGLKGWMALLITTITAITLAAILHKVIEIPSQQLGKRLAYKRKEASQPALLNTANT